MHPTDNLITLSAIRTARTLADPRTQADPIAARHGLVMSGSEALVARGSGVVERIARRPRALGPEER